MNQASSVFSSNRERRLWTWVLIVVVTIFATLELTATLVGQVDEGLLALAFLLCLIMVGLTIVTQGLAVRPGGVEIGVTGGIIAVYVLLGVRMAIPERSHLMEYGVLAVLVYEAIHERLANERHVPFPNLFAFLIPSAIGVLDESIQAILPNRTFDWQDIIFNVLAALAAVLGMMVMRWARTRTKPTTP